MEVLVIDNVKSALTQGKLLTKVPAPAQVTAKL